jgi:hypothetical protein
LFSVDTAHCLIQCFFFFFHNSVDGAQTHFKFSTKSDRITLLSCNRYAQDNDTTMFAELERTPSDLAIHMGDQVCGVLLLG